MLYIVQQDLRQMGLADRRPPRPADARFQELVPSGARLERLWRGAAWLEGPVCLPGGDVLFSDIPNDRVLRWSNATGDVSVETQPCGFANGHTLDRSGRVIRCEHGGRRISRIESDGTISCVVDRYEGRRLNSPNDVVTHSDGAIWFTDPPYGIISDREGHRAESELGDNYVFRFDTATGKLAIATNFIEEPNGLAFSPDEKLLYVSDTSAALRPIGGNHHIVAFDVIDKSRLENPRFFVVVDHGLADGFRVDARGNVFTSSAAGILVYSPEAEFLGMIPVPEVVSNCTFGGPHGRRLFITATTSLYSIDLNTTGATAMKPSSS